jgi:predicted nuclease with TOPRIM domain
MSKKINVSDDTDFGFSFLDEDYEEVKQKLESESNINQEHIVELKKRVQELYNNIIPFLDNLCKNPEKSTIHWPNRVDKIEKYKEKLKNIAEGK